MNIYNMLFRSSSDLCPLLRKLLSLYESQVPSLTYPCPHDMLWQWRRTAFQTRHFQQNATGIELIPSPIHMKIYKTHSNIHHWFTTTNTNVWEFGTQRGFWTNPRGMDRWGHPATSLWMLQPSSWNPDCCVATGVLLKVTVPGHGGWNHEG